MILVIRQGTPETELNKIKKRWSNWAVALMSQLALTIMF
jgi:hypothetical protein